MSSYATECALRGIKINWRNSITECGIQCPEGQKYQVCGNSCTRTCYDIAIHPECKVRCAEGCNCPDGQSLDDNGKCAPISQCKCQLDGLSYSPGHKMFRPIPGGYNLW